LVVVARLATVFLFAARAWWPGADPRSLGWLLSLAALAFILVLCWRLGHWSANLASAVPASGERKVAGRERRAYSIRLAGLVAAAIISLAVGAVWGGWMVFMAGTSLAALAVVAAWRRRLNPRLVVTGLALGLLPALMVAASSRAAGSVLSAAWPLLVVPVQFVAGALLARRDGRGRVLLLENRPAATAGAFLWGCAAGGHRGGGLRAQPGPPARGRPAQPASAECRGPGAAQRRRDRPVIALHRARTNVGWLLVMTLLATSCVPLLAVRRSTPPAANGPDSVAAGCHHH
jgi:hypothetical protein